jgi:hypothetical protein
MSTSKVPSLPVTPNTPESEQAVEKSKMKTEMRSNSDGGFSQQSFFRK